MYNITPEEYVTEYPWIRSFSQRLNELFDAKKSGLKTVVYLYEAADTSTFRYRVYNMCQSLELSLRWRGTYFYRDELSDVENYLDEIDLLVVARFRWTFALNDLIDHAKKRGIKVVFDVDDMVFNVKYLPTIVNTLSVNMADEASYDFWFSMISRLGMSAQKCDAVIATNSFLLNKLTTDLEVPGYIIQNFTNRIQEDVSKLYSIQKEKIGSSGKFVIGYFSGTPSHISDFLVVAPEIKSLLEKYEDVVLRIVGFMNMPDYLLDLEAAGRIERIPLVNFVDLQKEIAAVDVNIAPLVNNEFSNCKSELKFFEASIVGTITCATPTYTFKDSIENGVTGYLCERGEWFKTLEDIYVNRQYKMTDMEKKARKYCVDRYAYYNQTAHIESVFEQITKQS